MISKPLGITAVLLFTLSVMAACGGQGTNSSPVNRSSRSNDSNSPKTNAEELGMLVKIPYETEDIVWKNYSETKRILAVLRFSPADANKIVTEAGGTPEGRSLSAETWFPAELTAQSEMSGDSALKGISYPATAFYQEPYSTGKITRIEGTDYFVLELTSK
jgi:ABC-type Fe3+-hydroxamate transport system substrate-binding protein